MRSRTTLPVALALTTLLAACVSGPPQPKGPVLPKPGEEMLEWPEAIWTSYECGARKRPYLRIEEVKLFPERVTAGSAFNHRVVYSLCPEKPGISVKGKLITALYHRGKKLYSDLDEDFELKPGRWRVDSSVKVPAGAKPGVYAIELNMRHRSVRFREIRKFTVETP